MCSPQCFGAALDRLQLLNLCCQPADFTFQVPLGYIHLLAQPGKRAGYLPAWHKPSLNTLYNQINIFITEEKKKREKQEHIKLNSQRTPVLPLQEIIPERPVWYLSRYSKYLLLYLVAAV